MSAFLFGVCGCCNGLSGEAQTAYAYAPYWMGNIGMDSNNEPIINPLSTAFADKIPPVIFLTLTTVWTWDGGTNTQVVSYDKNGKATVTGDAGYPPGASNTHVSYSISDAYYYQDAVDYALQLLATIELLNPDKTYPVTSTASNSSQTDFVQKHFCYPSEAASYPGEPTVNLLMYGPNRQGNLLYSPEGYIHTENANNYEFPGDFTGNPGAWRGFVPSSQHYNGGSSGIYLDGYVLVKKQAWRDPIGYSRRGDHLGPFNDSPFSKIVYNPAKLDPGENLILPSDVPPDYGWIAYDNTALAPLSAQKNTADNVTKTADDMDTTADSI